MRKASLWFTAFFLVTCRSVSQEDNIVQPDPISTDLHRVGIGKIVFTSRSVSSGELRENDFMKSYELTNKSNLFITVFMRNSLTNFLHKMEPALTAGSLVKAGGYQFSIYIDGALIYQSNIQGAPLPAVKNKETIISKPLIDNQHEGVWWSQYFWNRFIYNGGDSVLTDGPHRLKMEIRPYLKKEKIETGTLIAEGELALQVNRKPAIDITKISLNAISAYPGIPVSDEKFDYALIKKLKGNIGEAIFRNITSIVVIKNGRLLIEEYFNGANRNSMHDTRSVGKSFTSTITGIAIGEGYLKNEDQRLSEFYDFKSFGNYSELKERQTLKNLLTMSAVFDGDDNDGDSPGNEENMYPTDNWVKFALDLPVNEKNMSGQWHYFTAGVVVMGDILNKKVPGGLESYADKKLFKPLGITAYKWQHTPQHVANTAGGLEMNSLDFAKYGLLYSNKGLWNGKQLIPGQWIEKTFTKHKAIPERQDEFYGFLFWNKTFVVGGKKYEADYCTGNGGNKIYIFKDQPLVVVITATAYGAPYAHPQVDKMMNEYVLPAIFINQK